MAGVPGDAAATAGVAAERSGVGTMTITKATDQEYEDHVIDAVESTTDGWAITHDGLTLSIPRKDGIEPHVGDIARFYGSGLGSVVRGVDINGAEVYYLTPADQELQHRADNAKREAEQIESFLTNKKTLDAQYDALPSVFQKRLDRFRRNNLDFRWRNEAYEMSCCVDAIKIAAACPTPDAIKAFYDLPWERQQEMIPDLYDGHSGNSFGMACRLAQTYIDCPALVPLVHGALCALMGCDEYGCAPLPSHEEFEAAKESCHGR
jgi:hypothetical protein